MPPFSLNLPTDWTHRHLDATDSTMLRLREDSPAEADAPFTLLTADYQTAGRGQRGNGWEAAPAANLLFGFRFHPRTLRAADQFALSEALALAVAESLDAYAEGFCVKWPNDVYWRDRKICGMLLEHDLCGSRIETTITGVGLNVNQTEFRSDAPNPTSLRLITGRAADRAALLEAVVRAFAAHYRALLNGGADALHARYCQRLYRRTGLHAYRDAGGEFTAELADVSPQGLLTLRRTDGSLRTYAFKEVSIVLPPSTSR